MSQADSLPVVLLPISADDDALDACLAALDAGTPSGVRVWLADDAQAGPRGIAIIERWLQCTGLRAEYTRRPRAIGESVHLEEMLRACGDADVAVLAPDALPLPGWLQQLADCLARDASIATATPWSNAGETVAWPRAGELNPLPADVERLARACAAMPLLHPELPSAITHAVLIRGSARARAGGLDTHSYGSWYAALVDLSLRMSGLGWRNVLCDDAFVGRRDEGRPAEGDMELLANRWPTWTARLAEFLMDDPLHAHRLQLQQAYAQAPLPEPQRDLFDAGTTPGQGQP
ncbi:glycosyltransferase [Stenotrophomonas daejeonensis]|uniref:Glycosyltransferase n=1 Tax=Stenotrophomonas daejeonensis TaxID=659018 RepID=A0A0R0DYX8_9GAMM|nr:glycosyltransferase [Stenotrophomonas daejeonensis]KRG82986.1 glycosyltransferase [Stenotrophomonas daejeonensis]